MSIPQAMKNVFGEDVKLHPVTKRPIETGRGALPVDQQALMHLADVEKEEGQERADAMRKQMGIPTESEIAAKRAEAAEAEKARQARIDTALALLEEHEKNQKAEAKLAASAAKGTA